MILNIRRIILSVALLWGGVYSTMGQSGVSLYHMQGATFQGSNFNPSFIPEGKVFFGLPVISGVAINYNNFVSYNDVIVDGDPGRKAFSYDGLNAAAGERNMINLEADISTFYLGFRSGNTAVTFFANERIGARIFLPKDLIRLAVEGNAPLVGSQVNLSKITADVKYYREIGIGFWKHFPKKKASIGLRAKYIIGIVDGSTDKNFDGRFTTKEDNFGLAFNVSEAIVNTSGLGILENGTDQEIQSHIINNSNVGFGIDIGANWKINEYLSAALAINDLGFINWKVDPKNYSLKDTTFNYNGLDFGEDIDDFQQTLEDSLVNRFENTETTNSYKTSLNTRTYASLIYDMTPRDKVIATIANHSVQGRLRMIYGLGYTRKVGRSFNFSANVVKLPQQSVNLGLGAAVNLGSLQIYMASDHILGLGDVTKLTGLDLRFGMNFIFGRDKNSNNKDQPTKDDRSDLRHDYKGKGKDKGPKREGIYYIIKKKKPRPVYEKKKFREV